MVVVKSADFRRLGRLPGARRPEEVTHRASTRSRYPSQDLSALALDQS